MQDFSLLTTELEYPMSKSNKSKKIAFWTIGLIIFFLAVYFLFFSVPSNFPEGSMVEVKEKTSLRSISLDLQTRNIIRSRIVFEAIVIVYGGEKHVVSGDYFFENKTSVFEVSRRMSSGDRRLVAIKVTIPEGFNVAEIGSLFTSKLMNFNEDLFLLEAKSKEGYLFPDTYFFFPIDDEKYVIKIMYENFKKKITPLQSEIIASGKTEKEIIVMASIIEKEAKGDLDRGFISGILWKRIKLGMPLQVDAALETYQAKGLPDGPIANPGLLSIKAAISPIDSPYLYYLHDNAGVIHYAKNFEEHKANKFKYLKQN
ncbi:MAG: endolytic transglycosylase MltG [bacterium]|nr:endolytic transglycosylase MltG [bacterium]